MREVTMRQYVPVVDVTEVFERISDFGAYPRLVDVVRSVAVHPPTDDGLERSDWEVYFRNGILRWTEDDRKDPVGRTIEFEQVDGDFETFYGSWVIVPDGAACEVRFSCNFDFGIPSLAGILDPIAQRVLKETISRIVATLFEGTHPLDDPLPYPSGVAVARLPETGAM